MNINKAHAHSIINKVPSPELIQTTDWILE